MSFIQLVFINTGIGFLLPKGDCRWALPVCTCTPPPPACPAAPYTQTGRSRSTIFWAGPRHCCCQAGRRGQSRSPCKLPTARGAQSCVDVPQDSRQRPQLGYDALQRHGKGGRCRPRGPPGEAKCTGATVFKITGSSQSDTGSALPCNQLQWVWGRG